MGYLIWKAEYTVYQLECQCCGHIAEHKDVPHLDAHNEHWPNCINCGSSYQIAVREHNITAKNGS